MRFPFSRVKRLLKTDEAYAVLDATQATGGSWTAGGCALLALALHPLIPESQLYALGSGINAVEHVLLALPNGRFFDADGISDRATLLTRWEELELLSGVYLHPLAGTQALGEIPHREGDVRRVRTFIRRQLAAVEAAR